MRDRVSPRNARTPRASSFLKPTRSRAISTASRSLDAPSDALASSRSRGSSQNALRTFPTREARAPEFVARVRDDRRRACDLPRRVDIGICPSFVRNIVPHRTHEHGTRAEPQPRRILGRSSDGVAGTSRSGLGSRPRSGECSCASWSVGSCPDSSRFVGHEVRTVQQQSWAGLSRTCSRWSPKP